MANENDSRVIQEMLSLPQYIAITYFTLNSHRISSDAAYWNTLGTLWKHGGTVIQQEKWKALFQSPRKMQHKIMKTRERRQFRSLPKSVIGYRAVNSHGEVDTAISWSLNKRIAEKVFSENGKRQVVSRRFNKNEVFAFFDRRGEEEILVNIGCKVRQRAVRRKTKCQ